MAGLFFDRGGGEAVFLEAVIVPGDVEEGFCDGEGEGDFPDVDTDEGDADDDHEAGEEEDCADLCAEWVDQDFLGFELGCHDHLWHFVSENDEKSDVCRDSTSNKWNDGPGGKCKVA